MRSPRIGELARAIERSEIVPYFQPLVEFATAPCWALRFWRAEISSATRPLLTPNAFIALAEKAGLIGELSEALFEAAAGLARAWPPALHMSFNISPYQLQDHELADRLAAIAERTGFSLSRLMIEVTESALIGPLDVAQRIIDRLKGYGVRLSLDDFGTGYASLSLLQALPFDLLKIDASFIRSMLAKRESRKIVAAAIGLGHSLGIETVAEGVSSEEQAAMLLGLGCGIAQGWLFGAPASDANLAPRAVAPTAQIGEAVMVGLEALPTQRLAQLQALYDDAPVGLAFLDCDLRYISLNRYLAQMHGLPVAAHIGRTVAEILPDLFEKIAPLLQRALDGTSVMDHITQEETPDSSTPARDYCVSYSPARDVAGEIVGISVAVIQSDVR